VTSQNPRSTVGTTTEIYEYLKLLFARIGKTYSPVTGQPVRRDSVSDVVDFILALPSGTRLTIFAPLPAELRNDDLKAKCNVLIQQGFSRVMVDGEVIPLDEAVQIKRKKIKELLILIDRVAVDSEDPDLPGRIADSVQTAFFESHGYSNVETAAEKPVRRSFSNKFEADGIEFEEPSENLFSFNNPYGACKTCEGFGSIIGIDEDLVVPNKNLSIYEDAIACWRGEKMGEWKNELVMNAYRFDFPIHKPFYELTPEQTELLWKGNSWFHGLTEFFEFVESQNYKVQYRVMLSRYRGKTVCPECRGTRLRKDANYVKVQGLSLIHISEPTRPY
jgi:excinuclease ABC subunit A